MDILLIVMILVLVILGGVIFYMIMQMLTYKHWVQIREIVNGRKRIRNYKAKDYRDAEGGVFWKLKGGIKELQLLEVPPNESIEMNNKGKFFVIAYRSPTGDIKYAKDSTIAFNDIKEFKPFTSTQRVMLFNQFKKSADRRGKKWTDHLPMIVVGAQILIILVLIAVFMEDVAKPFISAKELQLQQQTILLEQTTILQEMQQDIQRIKSVTGTKTEIKGSVPN
jgi:hypothetical protein